eukprot:3756406-Lingulodinium_polyedra.AAC.1
MVGAITSRVLWLDTLLRERDHAAVVVHARLGVRGRLRGGPGRRARRYDRNAVRDPQAVRLFVEEISKAPHPHWLVDVHAHCEYVEA